MNSGTAARAGKLLRSRRFSSVLALVAIAIASALLAVTLVDHFIVLTSANSFVQDWEVAYFTTPKAPDDDIVIVAIDEKTLSFFPYRSPLDRGYLNHLVGELGSYHPRAIGIDYLFDQPTVADKDSALRQTLKSSQIPLVVAYQENPPPAVAPPIVTQSQLAYERFFVPQPLRAFPNLTKDGYGTVRSIYPGGKDIKGQCVDGFAWALAETYDAKLKTHKACPDKDAKEHPIVWRAAPQGAKNAFTEIAALAVLCPIRSCAKKPPPKNVVPFKFKFPAKTFQNKIVLIGSDESLVDRDRTPFAARSEDGNVAGITVHANAIATLINHEHWRATGWGLNVFVALILALIGGVLGILNFNLAWRIAAIVAVLILFWASGAALFYYHNAMLGLLAPSLAMIASFGSMDSLTGREARHQRQFIQRAFSRYVSHKVVEQLVADPTKLSLEGERRVMTYLFTDIAGFTSVSEFMEGKDLALMLNAYLEGMTSIVLRHEGMVDKFIGDAVFAIFNAPVDLEDHAQRAVQCALDMDDFAENFRREQNDKDVNFGLTRIGVHTGAAVVGNFGSQAHFNYTAQGDAVNTASRLEGLNKTFGTRLCVSDDTRALCPNIAFREIASVVLKGKTKPTMVWEPLHPGRQTPELLERYHAAFAKLKAQDPAAQALFEGLAQDVPDDSCIAWHCLRLRSGATGVEAVMTEK